MKKSDFNIPKKDLPKCIETAGKIAKNKNCHGIGVMCSSDFCPFSSKYQNVVKGCGLNYYDNNYGLKDYYRKTSQQFIDLFTQTTKIQALKRIKELKRQIKRQETNIRGYKNEINHCREVLKKEERKCIAEKVELNIGGKIYTGIMMQN